MRALICGSRSFEDAAIVKAVLHGMSAGRPITVIEGGATGADHLANTWAVVNGARHEKYPAKWTTHGKAAGHIRNQQMLNEGQPDVVIAFIDKPLTESKGTHNMVRRARQAGIPTYVVEKMP
jgi:YspA, cpYpsA-related SLOG family